MSSDRTETPPATPEDDPVFAEPWQARAFALVLKLSDQGYFTRKEWTAALASEIANAPARGWCGKHGEHGQRAGYGDPDDGERKHEHEHQQEHETESHYYEHWLTALEKLAVEKGLTDLVALTARKEAWRDAYHRTPHGKPVELAPDQLKSRPTR